jgi:hypothetical protein
MRYNLMTTFPRESFYGEQGRLLRFGKTKESGEKNEYKLFFQNPRGVAIFKFGGGIQYPHYTEYNQSKVRRAKTI